MARAARWHNLSRFVFGQQEVKSGEPEVPCHYKEVGEDLRQFLRCTHGVDDGKHTASRLEMVLGEVRAKVDGALSYGTGRRSRSAHIVDSIYLNI